jgi:hypothetical protein
MRVALRTSNVDPNYKRYINEAIAAGVFEGNEDNATFKYLGVAPNNAPLYDAFFTSNRNDFTLAKPFVDLLKGENDILNNKQNPFAGAMDPRLTVWARPVSGQYKGIPYGIPNNSTASARAGTVNFYTNPTIVVAADAPLVYMDYAEVCFILSEVNGFNQQWYEKGVQASLDFWGEAAASSEKWSKDRLNQYTADVQAYIAKLPPANIETVLTQKYISLFLQGYQAWAEYRRTGYPKLLLKPGEISYRTADGTDVRFVPLVGNDIPKRLTYPVSEQTLNAANYRTATTSMGTDDMATPVWWDK